MLFYDIRSLHVAVAVVAFAAVAAAAAAMFGSDRNNAVPDILRPTQVPATAFPFISNISKI